MGIGMALNLQNHLASNGLPPLRYSNRTLSRGDGLQEAGGLPERDFETLVLKSTVVFTMVRVAIVCPHGMSLTNWD